MDSFLTVVLSMKTENTAMQQKEATSMKKVRTGILATALLLSIGVTGAFAAGSGWGRHAACNGAGTPTGTACRYIDADGDGICDNCGTGQGCTGLYYADADSNGVCDHFEDGGHCGRGMHTGCRR